MRVLTGEVTSWTKCLSTVKLRMHHYHDNLGELTNVEQDCSIFTLVNDVRVKNFVVQCTWLRIC